MRDSIFYSSIKALSIAFFSIIGLVLGLCAILFGITAFSANSSASSRLTSVTTEEILPNADGKREVLSKDAPIILQINIEGAIGAENLTANDIEQILVESREGDYKDDRVKAVLLHMNTPGGYATDSDSIFRSLLAYKEKYKVPIFAYVNGLCASGGVYVSLAADKIFATDTSLVGSVGVIAPSFFNVSKVLEKFDIETVTLFAGKGKDAMNPLRPWKSGESDNYRELIDYLYSDFVNLVTKYRPAISKEKLVEEYGAHIYPAPLAKEYGYVDETGVPLKAVLEELAKAAGLEDQDYQVIKLENSGWWRSFFKNQSPLITGEIKHRLSVSKEMELCMQNKFLYLYAPGLMD